MKTLKIGLLSVLVAVLVAGYLVIAKAEPTKAQSSFGDLGDLIVLNGLFNGNGIGGSDWGNLAGLIAVDRITSGDGITGGSLGDLIVLNGLFNGGNMNVRDLAGLIAIDRLTR